MKRRMALLGMSLQNGEGEASTFSSKFEKSLALFGKDVSGLEQVGEKGLAKLLRSSELSEEEAQKLIAQFGESGAVNLEQLKAVFGHKQGQKRSQSRAREP